MWSIPGPLVVISCFAVSIFCRSTENAIEEYDPINARIDQLEERLIEQGRKHWKDRVDMRNSHRGEIDKLRKDYDTILGELRHDFATQMSRIHHLEATVKRQTDIIQLLLDESAHDQETEQESHAGVAKPDIGDAPEDSVVEGSTRKQMQPVQSFQRKSVKRMHHIRQVDTKTKVAFFTTLSYDLLHLPANQIIQFDHVITNIGTAYHPDGGKFIAPVSGTYVFSATLRTLQSHTSHYALYKGSEVITSMYVNGNMNNYDTVSNTVILYLNKGDDVMIRHVDSDHALRGLNYTMFSGFLLLENLADSSSIIVGK